MHGRVVTNPLWNMCIFIRYKVRDSTRQIACDKTPATVWSTVDIDGDPKICHHHFIIVVIIVELNYTTSRTDLTTSMYMVYKIQKTIVTAFGLELGKRICRKHWSEPFWYLFLKFKAWFWQAKHVCGSVQFGSVRFTLVACAVKITFCSLWFNMESVDIINFENKLRLGHVKVSSGNARLLD